jgi:hypothetical protein
MCSGVNWPQFHNRVIKGVGISTVGTVLRIARFDVYRCYASFWIKGKTLFGMGISLTGFTSDPEKL